MQFLGQTHILNVPLPSADVARAMLQEPVREGLFRALQGRAAGNPRQSRQPQHLGHRRAARRSTCRRLIDPAGRAATLDGALREIRPVWYDGAWLDTPVYVARKTAARRGDRRARRSSSRWTRRRCWNPATGRAATRTGTSSSRWGSHEHARRHHPFRHPGRAPADLRRDGPDLLAAPPSRRSSPRPTTAPTASIRPSTAR